MRNQNTKQQREEFIEDIKEEYNECARKQFSKNPYYVLMRFFGADWFWQMRHLREWGDYLESLQKFIIYKIQYSENKSAKEKKR